MLGGNSGQPAMRVMITKVTKKHGYLDADKKRLDNFRDGIKTVINAVKENYLCKIGYDLADPQIGQKCYWKIVNRIMNKCKAVMTVDTSSISRKKPQFL